MRSANGLIWNHLFRTLEPLVQTHFLPHLAELNLGFWYPSWASQGISVASNYRIIQKCTESHQETVTSHSPGVISWQHKHSSPAWGPDVGSWTSLGEAAIWPQMSSTSNKYLHHRWSGYLGLSMLFFLFFFLSLPWKALKNFDFHPHNR